MNNLEFSNEFDILYNQVMSNAAPPLNEYEKSIFLTKAQEQILRNYFSPKTNALQEGVNDSQKRELDFYKLVTFEECELVDGVKYDDRSVLFKMPNNIFAILNEKAKTQDGRLKEVKQIHYTDYNKMMNKPFKYPLKNQAWRLSLSGDLNLAEIIGGPEDEIKEYTIRYIRNPKPIILEDLDVYDVQINGQDKYSECELEESIHREIIEMAVYFAKVSYIGQSNNQQSNRE